MFGGQTRIELAKEWEYVRKKQARTEVRLPRYSIGSYAEARSDCPDVAFAMIGVSDRTRPRKVPTIIYLIFLRYCKSQVEQVTDDPEKWTVLP